MIIKARRARYFGIVASIFLAALMSGCGGDEPTKPQMMTIYVKKGYKGIPNGSQTNPYPTITQGVGAAPEAATIIVMEGEYIEKEIKLKKGQRLISATPLGATITYSNNYYNLVQLFNCDGCEVRNFKFIFDPYRSLKDSLYCKKSNNAKLINNYFEGIGPYFDQCNGLIQGNKVDGLDGIGATPMAGSGELIVENNEIHCYNVGMYPSRGLLLGGVDYSARLIVRNNKVTGAMWAVPLGSSVNLVFENNVIEDNDEGIYIQGGNYSWAVLDFGGGAGGSQGRNSIRNNGIDLENESPVEIMAKNNRWSHNNAKDIDKYDILDDDENKGGKVIFEPFIQ